MSIVGSVRQRPAPAAMQGHQTRQPAPAQPQGQVQQHQPAQNFAGPQNAISRPPAHQQQAPVQGQQVAQVGRGIVGGAAPIQAAPRPAPAAPRPAPAGWLKRGAQAKAVLEQEQQDAARRKEERERNAGVPYRFYVEQNKSRELIILDTEPGPCRYEHGVKSAGSQFPDVFEACPKEFENCPICEGALGAAAGNNPVSSYVMLMTCIDLTPVYNDDGTVKRNYSYRLLVLKPQEHGFFHRYYEQNGTLRGLRLRMVRDGDKSPRSGRPEYVGHHTHEDIMASFAHPAIMSQQTPGKVVKPENAECFAIDYEAVLQPPSADYLRQKYRLSPPIGSRAYNAQAGGAPIQGAPAQSVHHGQQQDDNWAGHDPGAANLPGGHAQPGTIAGIPMNRQNAAPAAGHDVDDIPL